MGICLSCLGLGQQKSHDPEHSHLLYSDDPYNQSGNSYGTYGAQVGIAPQQMMNSEDLKREQEALEGITRWTGDRIVEIFPHQPPQFPNSTSNANSSVNGLQPSSSSNINSHDAFLAMIPGDKSTRSIRIYPASRPGSQASGASSKSKVSSSRVDEIAKEMKSKVFVKLEVDLT